MPATNQLPLQLVKIIPPGFCKCGCGNKTLLAPRTDIKRGWIKGQPKPCITKHGHRNAAINGNGVRICTMCYREQPFSAFYPVSRKRDRDRGRGDLLTTTSVCRKCNLKRNRVYRKKNREKCFSMVARSTLKRMYGMTGDDYAVLLKSQHGVCAICKQTERKIVNGEPQNLSVDHDHVTGKVRGLLCSRCNLFLGRIEDSIQILCSAIDYLSPITLEEVIGI